MAGRQHRLLLKEKLGKEIEDAAISSEDESSIEEQKPIFNPFSLLTDDEDETKSATTDESDEDVDPPPPPQKPSPQIKKTTPSKQTKGKEKKQEEDIDTILQELNITPTITTTVPSSNTAPTYSSAKPLFSIDLRFLKKEEELKRMFGHEAVSNAHSDPSSSSHQQDVFMGASRRIRRLAARGLIGHVQHKPGHFITPKDTWPPFQHSEISIQQTGYTSDGTPIFTYHYTEAYEAIQRLYEECQASFDPNSIAALLRQHPWHLDSLITMADLYRSMGENAYGDEMMERCLYALEVIWPSNFTNLLAGQNTMAASSLRGGNSGNGVCLPYEEKRNVPLHIALFKHIQALGRRGLHRTALECCKVLLVLDKEDPMGVLFMIDYFAVRASQYEFLYRFVEEYGQGSAAVFPNMVFSVALAKWYQERAAQSKNAAPLSTALTASSMELLVKAIAMHPRVVVRLQQKLQEKGTGNDAAWQSALSSSFLVSSSSDAAVSASLRHIIDIFVERQRELWRSAPVQAWLLEATQKVIQSFELGVDAEGEELPCGGTVADWHMVATEAFPRNRNSSHPEEEEEEKDENRYSHLRLYDFSDEVARLPPEDIHGMMQPNVNNVQDGMDFGNMNVDELNDIVAAAQQELGRQMEGGGAGAGNLEEMSPLMALLRSFLPWNDDAQQPDYDGANNNNEQ